MMYALVQDQGLREYMEDTHIIEENIFPGMDILGVFDGHGGGFVSDYLQKNFVNVFKEVMRTGALSIIEALYHTVKGLVDTIPVQNAFTCGSTYLVCVKYGDVLYCVNAGDCRAIVNVGNSAFQITKDHKPHMQSEFERIQRLGGSVSFHPNDVPRVNGNLAVSRSMGDLYLFPLVTWEPEGFMLTLNPQYNVLAIASDGVWDVMTNQDVIDICIRHIIQNEGVVAASTLQQAAQEVLHVSRARGSGDNITLILKVL